MISNKSRTIEEYIADLPRDVQEVLHQIRALIKEIAPTAEETISYDMPTFKLYNTYLVYFAAFKNHIGFYGLPLGDEAFKSELLAYKVGKGSIQFPKEKPIPFDLIDKIVRFRIEEILKKGKTPKTKKVDNNQSP